MNATWLQRPARVLVGTLVFVPATGALLAGAALTAALTPVVIPAYWACRGLRGLWRRWHPAPGLSEAERRIRDVMGVPIGHPELITAELSRDDEALLAELAAEAWPEDEYAEIIHEFREETQ